MYSCDEVIASGYFVFGNELSCHIVGILLSELKAYKMYLCNKKLDKLANDFIFDSACYKLNDNASLEKVNGFVRGELVVLFNGIKLQLEHSEKQNKLIKE